jgi:hypothetical protein
VSDIERFAKDVNELSDIEGVERVVSDIADKADGVGPGFTSASGPYAGVRGSVFNARVGAALDVDRIDGLQIAYKSSDAGDIGGGDIYVLYKHDQAYIIDSKAGAPSSPEEIETQLSKYERLGEGTTVGDANNIEIPEGANIRFVLRDRDRFVHKIPPFSDDLKELIQQNPNRFVTLDELLDEVND